MCQKYNQHLHSTPQDHSNANDLLSMCGMTRDSSRNSEVSSTFQKTPSCYGDTSDQHGHHRSIRTAADANAIAEYCMRLMNKQVCKATQATQHGLEMQKIDGMFPP